MERERESWFWSEAWGKPSSGWSHWLVHLGGIIRVVFGLKHGECQMWGLNSRGLSSPEHEKMEQRWVPNMQTEGQ
jgi:hypothetical protein